MILYVILQNNSKIYKVSEMEKEYIINGIVYSYQNHFDDDLFEARLIDFETGNVFFFLDMVKQRKKQNVNCQMQLKRKVFNLVLTT